jgi:hypothetical protein
MQNCVYQCSRMESNVKCLLYPKDGEICPICAAAWVIMGIDDWKVGARKNSETKEMVSEFFVWLTALLVS